jgi:hypothetical protein
VAEKSEGYDNLIGGTKFNINNDPDNNIKHSPSKGERATCILLPGVRGNSTFREKGKVGIHVCSLCHTLHLKIR